MTVASIELGQLPASGRMVTVDAAVVRAPLPRIFELARDVERWPSLLPHYRFVRFHERDASGGGVVEMSANRPFGALRWPTWWTSQMSARRDSKGESASIRFRHVRGITTGMEVEWQFTVVDRGAQRGATQVRVIHVWDGPAWPLIGAAAARLVIGPVFVHGIASRTLAWLARAAEAR